MRIFVAGATGALGRRLTPLLVRGGHHVTGTTRTSRKAEQLRAAGVEPATMDGLDRDAVMEAVAAAKPDVVVHQLTALSGSPDLRRFDKFFTETNRLRVEGTDHLLAAAQAAGARRFIAQSFTGWPNERSGSPVKTEDDPLDPHPAAASRQTVAAIRHVETVVRAASGIEGVVLRYGGFYGPGNTLGAGGELLEMVRKRRLPVVGGGGGVWSFVHIDDAARATVLAVEDGAPGLYNIVDDEPAPVREWLPYLAQVIGAKPPMRAPAWLVRPMLGEHGVSLMTRIRGSSNAKAKRELGWTLAYPSWREGFRDGL
ncbi:MAG: NAD-dependent epimerase/dehydratase family protein [Micromonosporaceae bacterium]|nr:NAD-dependent epimerase/dehydratase family protein [Micromonosporaceae bacterium]